MTRRPVSPTPAGDGHVPFLWLYGADGVGKSSVAAEIFSTLTRAGTLSAFVYFDWLGWCRPVSEEDPDNHRLKARNLGAMWANFQADGAQCVVASGIVESRMTTHLYATAIPEAVLTLCRLRASGAELAERILRRGHALGGTKGALSGTSLDRLHRLVDDAQRYACTLETDDIADFHVDTDGLSAPEVADRVVERAGGWPALV